MTDHGRTSNERKNAATAAHAPVVHEPDASGAHGGAHGSPRAGIAEGHGAQGAGHGAQGAGHGAPGAGHGAHDPTDVQLGPIDWPAWLAGAAGIAAGLVVIAAMYLAGRS